MCSIQFVMPSTHKLKGWNQQEDKIIKELVSKHGIKSWAKIAREMTFRHGLKGKSGKQCRERWFNHLNPGITKEDWTQQQQAIMFMQHKVIGNQWKLIAQSLPGRTDNAIKNHFYSTIRRSLRRMSKLTGSKNSTFQMRKIKPQTLSKIFSIAEGRQLEIDQSFWVPEMANQNASKKLELLQELKKNCSEVAQHLMKFASEKPSEFGQSVSTSNRQIYINVLQKMNEINQLYQGQKQTMAKIRKQKKLQRNFDAASLSSEEIQQRQVQSIEVKEQYISQQNKIRKNKKSNQIKFPTFNPQEADNFQNQYTKKKPNSYLDKRKSDDSNLQIRRSEATNNYLEKEDRREKNDYKNSEIIADDGENFDFDIKGEEMSLFSIDLSPQMNNATLALTPTLFDSMMKETIQPIKNQDCTNILKRLKNQIQQNNCDNSSQMRRQHEGSLFPSPMSAFRQYE